MILITDIDGTLANERWRESYKPDWDEYHRASTQDEPFAGMAKFLEGFSAAGWTIIAISTRPEKWRQITLDWLIFYKFKIDQLHLRPNDDYRGSPTLKSDIASPLKVFSPVLALDDREDVLAAYLALGFTTFHVRHP